MSNPARTITARALLFGLLATGLAIVGLPVGHAADQDAKTTTKRVLLITGEDYPGHKWQETAPALKKVLEKDPRLIVTVMDDLKKLRTEKLSDYDAAIIHFKNYDPAVPGPDGWNNLEKFVKNGGGLVIVHFGCGAFQEWPDFVKLAGRVYDPKLPPHDPYGAFSVDVCKPDHPITKGIGPIQTTDELYTCLAGDTPIEVLATSTSKLDKKPHPMAFVLDYGKGRVFHSPLGHDAKAFEFPGVAELMRRATAWAAGLPSVAK